MLHYTASTTINAKPETIWAIITDAEHYPEWDPSAIRIEGDIAAGETVTAYTKLAPDRAFPAKVSTYQPNSKMVWSSGMPFGLFKGVRTFLLTPKGDGVTEFTLSEEFSGFLLPLFKGNIPDMTETFQHFVAGLKARAEG